MGFAGNQVFGGDVADVPRHIATQRLRGFLPLAFAGGVAQGFEGLQRELGVHDDLQVAARQADQAVGPGATGQGGLEFVGRGRKGIGDDGLHARLAEGAAGLLVGENALQGENLSGKRVDGGLCPVDHGQPLRQLPEMLGGAFRLFLKSLADAQRYAVQPLGEQAGDVGVTGRCGLRLLTQLAAHLGELAFQQPQALLSGPSLPSVQPSGAPCEKQHQQEQQHDGHGQSRRQHVAAHGELADPEEYRIGRHGRECSVIRRPERMKREHLVPFSCFSAVCDVGVARRARIRRTIPRRPA